MKKLTRARAKHSHKSVHEEHADNLYKLAHPEKVKTKKVAKRSLTHVLVPMLLVLTTATIALGAEALKGSTKSMPAVPPASICRTFNRTLAAQDARIGVTMDDATYPFTFTFDFNNLSPNYLYALDVNGNEYSLSNLKRNVLDSPGGSFTYMKVCVADPGKAVPPFTSYSAMVDQQYRDFFGRHATSSEIAYWVSSGKSANEVINWFVDQDAPKRGPLVRLYKAYFRRWPDAGGYDYWIRKMKNGTTLTKVSDTFAASSEFKRNYGSLSNEQFVTLVYNNVLNRTPDASGYNYWVKRLNARTISRGGVMLQFSESSEFKRKYGLDCDLVGITLRMYRRPATDAELQQWNPDLDAYALAYPIVFQSDEYAARIVK